MKISYNTLYYTIIKIILFLFVSDLYSASFKPVVTNYKTIELGINAGTQNWSCTQGENGEMYFANNKGLLTYDSHTWTLAKLPNDIIVRSVFYDNGRIYIGSYEEFGYFKYDKYGNLKYYSLSKDIPYDNLIHKEIWSINKIDGKIYFQAFSGYYIYDGEKIYEGNLKISPLYFHNIHNKLYTQLSDKGYYRIEGQKCSPIRINQSTENVHIVAALPVNDRISILCSEKEGLFELKGDTAKPFNTKIDKKLKAYLINRATITKDSLIIIGTILNGVYAIDLEGNEKWHFNIDSGLNNNCILALYCDRDNNIWAALDNGIALIHLSTPYNIMVPERGDPQIGMIYDLEYKKDKLLIASNQGLYSYNLNSGEIEILPNTGGQNWHITTFNDQTFIGNNNHTLLLSDSEVYEIENTDGSSTHITHCNIHGKNILLESSYSDLRIYVRINDKWTLRNAIENFSAPIRGLEVDHSGTIWAANINYGIYRIELNNDLRTIKKYNYFKSANGSDKYLKYVMKIRGRIVFSDNEKLYTFDDIEHNIIPYEQLNGVLLSSKEIHSSTPVTDDVFWLSSKKGYALIKYKDNKFNVEHYVTSDFFGIQSNENEDMVCIRDNTAYFNMNNGIGRYVMNKRSISRWTRPDLKFQKVSFTSKNGVTTEIPLETSDNSPARTNGNVSFLMTFPNYNKEPVFYDFELSGETNIRTRKSVPEITYSDLDFGSYKLVVTAYNSLNKAIEETSYYFMVPPPYYLSTFAFAAYILIFILSIYIISKWRTEVALKKKRIEYERERNLQNIRMLEQEKLIAEQQQQILKTELSTKSKELASLALDVYSKEKVIESLKDSILAQNGKSVISQKEMNTILKNIESSTSNLEFWNIYQKNFDLIHENFFRNLHKQFPNLTASDLKFCALLRLNLSTKDIAKITNLTVRGVETARYRLRKKFNLNEKDSLVEFLIDFK